MTEKKEYRLAEKVLSGYVKNVSEAQNYISGFTVSEVVRFLRWLRSIFYVRRNELVSLTGKYLRG